MVGLSGGERISPMSIDVFTQNQRMRDGQADGIAATISRIVSMIACGRAITKSSADPNQSKISIYPATKVLL